MRAVERVRRHWFLAQKCVVIGLLAFYGQWLWKNDSRTRWILQGPLAEISGFFDQFDRGAKSRAQGWLGNATPPRQPVASKPAAHTSAKEARPKGGTLPARRRTAETAAPVGHIASTAVMSVPDTRRSTAVAATTAPEVPLAPTPRPLSAAEVAAHFDAGLRRFHDANYAEALADWNAVTRHRADDAVAWYFLALTQRTLGQWEAAERSLSRAVDAERVHPTVDLPRLLERVQGPARLWLENARQTAGVGPYRSKAR